MGITHKLQMQWMTNRNRFSLIFQSIFEKNILLSVLEVWQRDKEKRKQPAYLNATGLQSVKGRWCSYQTAKCNSTLVIHLSVSH